MGDNCEATIYSNGLTIVGSSGSNCYTTSGVVQIPTFTAWTSYDLGEKVRHNGKCYEALTAAMDNGGVPTFLPDDWGEVDCGGLSPTPITTHSSVKTIRFGEGLDIAIPSGTGSCCSGNIITVSAAGLLPKSVWI